MSLYQLLSFRDFADASASAAMHSIDVVTYMHKADHATLHLHVACLGTFWGGEGVKLNVRGKSHHILKPARKALQSPLHSRR